MIVGSSWMILSSHTTVQILVSIQGIKMYKTSKIAVDFIDTSIFEKCNYNLKFPEHVFNFPSIS